MTILAVDIGTTGMKVGLFEPESEGVKPLWQSYRGYEINIYNKGQFADIEPQKWIDAFIDICQSKRADLASVEVISMSGTTPGLTAMDPQGKPLYPAILMLDQRSRDQARFIRDTAGESKLLARTANLPVAGGSSLASILWLKDNEPRVFKKIGVFGHSNTFFAGWLTGCYAIDPSSASLTNLYQTTQNNLQWDRDIIELFGLSEDYLPRLVRAYESIGQVKTTISRELGFSLKPQVLVGGNDAVLAAYSLGVKKTGQVVNVNGTCEICMTCMDRCVPSGAYNVRAHISPDRWFTFHVMNAGGKAIEWFRSTFCSEMDDGAFFQGFAPCALQAWSDRDPGACYVPYLMGSRYSVDPMTASFTGLTPETKRAELFAAMIKGLCQYQGRHLEKIRQSTPLESTILLTGGAVSPDIIEAKRRWMSASDYRYEEQSSLRGAALLGNVFLT